MVLSDTTRCLLVAALRLIESERISLPETETLGRLSEWGIFVLDFATLPPEVNSARMYAGPGSGPMMAAASAWDALAVQLDSLANAYSSMILGLQGQEWSGGASVAMAAAATPYVEWATESAAAAEEAGARARAATAAYETAYTAIVPPTLVESNRTEFANLVAANVFGQNTALIAAIEAAYAEMWAVDAAVMYGYAASSSAASTLTPFREPPQTTNPAGQSGQAAAVAQAAGAGAAAHSQTALSQLMSALPQQLDAMASGPSGPGSALTAAGNFDTLSGPAGFAAAGSRTVTSAGSFLFGVYRSVLQSQGAIAKALTEPAAAGAVGAVGPISGSVHGPVLASVARAESVGGMSVPQRWAPSPPVATAVEEPMRLAEMDFGTGSSLEENPASGMAGGAPTAAMGPMAGMAGRPTVSSVLRVGPRSYKMPRPAIGG